MISFKNDKKQQKYVMVSNAYYYFILGQKTSSSANRGATSAKGCDFVKIFQTEHNE